MQKSTFKLVAIVGIFVLSTIASFAQNEVEEGILVPTATPFLNISPESRAGAMGDAGVATSADLSSQHWNSSKYAFLEQDMGVSVSFTPWLRNLVNDINLYYLTFFKRVDKMSTVSASLRYFSMGHITFTDDNGNPTTTGNPNEFAIDAAYSRLLSDNFSASIAFRYIRSDLLNGSGTAGASPGNAFAADLNFYYLQRVKWGGRKGDVSAGLNFSNLGSKISYNGGTDEQFLPANMRLGGAYSTEIDRYNKIGFTMDINKLMIAKGEENQDISVPASFFKSFGDMTLEDFMFSLGAEYWYDNQFALRAGYSHQDETRGNNKYATAGAGLKFNMFTIDASYIIPLVANNPLANTIRFSLAFNFDEMTGKNKRPTYKRKR
ncbi:type IX secretion system outer membrane channel protein PorV [Saccharicrinis aurantiacus]|uniref:type IX secretion system outer membrane channel protein PorV n=1 Tax=Saccharicrinis aurantiacus TaxID=1849719 RepID=UPI002492DC6F|nr:type IX secretion system outer membrane channel protein PorV [Saccharicrinis aurantiacus]